MKRKDIWFASDLDNTLIHSYKHRRKEDQCVEWLNGAEQSFMTRTSIQLLKRIHQSITLLAITTRSLEQYRRIQWPEGCKPDLAITTNGAFLIDGNDEEDSSWAEEMRVLCCRDMAEVERKYQEFQEDADVFRSKIVDDSYLFLYSIKETPVEPYIKIFQKDTLLSVEGNGRKLYFFPPRLNKGEALQRIRERFSPMYMAAAGDSLIDLPMLRLADISFIPKDYTFPAGHPAGNFLRQPPPEPVFSDWLLHSLDTWITSLPIS
ncbi:MAG: haloacid dehalogenase [Selenomonadaceae bacterium]|nr:haloacid dehalogenase [Selenomonadaceae bacterium]